MGRSSRQAGTGMTTVLVGISIMSLMVLALLNAVAASFKQEATLRGLLQGRELAGEASELMRSPNCGINGLPINVTDTTWAPTKEYSLTNGLTGRFLDIKKDSAYGNMTIDEIAIAPYLDRFTNKSQYISIDGPTPTDFTNAKRIKASIKITLKSNTPKAPLRLPIYIGVDAGRIVSCEAELDGGGQSLAAVCESLGGDWNEAETPKCKLKCPTGMVNRQGSCISATENTYCKVNEKCGVGPKFEIM